MTWPLVSVCMGTAQVDSPLLDRSDTVYEVLRRSVEQQTYAGPIEVIVADARPSRLPREMRARWGRSTRVVLTQQVLHDRVAVAGARNTAAAYARGDLIVFVDDCTELLPSFVEAAVEISARGEIPTRLLLESRGDLSRLLARGRLAGTTADVLRAGLAAHVFEDTDPQWAATGRATDARWRLTGQAGGVFTIPRELFLTLNGFDENFDGSWGCEDQELCARLDRTRLLRTVSSDLAVLRWAHRSTPLRTALPRCREIYARWAYRSTRVAANRGLSDEDLATMVSDPACGMRCRRCVPPDSMARSGQVATYRAHVADFDLRQLSARYGRRDSGIYYDPWR